ncbi:MAG: type II toxin-antitoxin system RelE/ParE family toxin [Natronospirillum sp.]
MSNRNLGTEILDGINEIKQFKKGKVVLSTHELVGNRAGTWSVTVSGNWRVTFIFVGDDAEVVNYEDYH